MLGWGHLGCYDSEAHAFLARSTEARAYVAADVDSWVHHGAPTPRFEAAGRLGFFVACGGARSIRQLPRAVASLERRFPEAVVRGGVFPDDVADDSALVAVARLSSP